MLIKVYLDILFIVNVFMNFFILSITSFIIKKSTSFIRILLSSSFGAALYCLVIFIGNFYYLSNFFICILILVSITQICFKERNIKHLIKDCLFTYLTALITGGICFYIYFLMKLKSFSVFLLLISSVCFYTIIKLSVVYIDQHIIDRRKYCKIEVCINGTVYNLNALIDTGTYIEEMKCGYAVIIAEERLFKDSDRCNRTFLPYKSLGQDGGILPAVYGDWAVINKRKLKNVLIGLYSGRFSDSFNAIISPESIGGGFYDTF